MDKLPTNAPTGGWGALNTTQGVPTSLPSTVEAHFWGKLGLRPYGNGEYNYEREDDQVRNGNYKGVSWWWRNVSVPKGFIGKRAVLHLRGARQRAEIYVNHKLVGYTLMEESAYDCDVTAALRPGEENQIAIRITNPGGRLDWEDWELLSWGGVELQKSHGFGGLDRGLTLTAHDPVALSDAWVLNTPEVHRVTAHAKVRNDGAQPSETTIKATAVDKSGRPVASSTIKALIAPGSEKEISFDLNCPNAKLWSVANPNLYRMRFEIVTPDRQTDRREVPFGFRWFAPDGIGTNAVLRFNGERIRIFSSISWGFWGINGLFPTPGLAEKEVRNAKRLGLNCLNFHRNVGKTEVMDFQDRLGLLRYMEPGGGGTAIGPKAKPGDTGVARTRGGAYTEEKIIRMIRDFRSHPSLILYVIENERGDDDSNNPRIDHLMRRMHAEDPSRTIVLKSGLGPNGEVWMKPYDETIYRDQGHGAGWWDNHTVGFPDATWQDQDYQAPDHFAYDSRNKEEIVDWGEMGGSGTPDDHAKMLRQTKGEGYDAQDHREILAAYDAFLTKWGFRSAFPTASSLFRSVGDRQYEYWGYVLGAARLSDENDYLTLSGWETTAVENHSGVVDNLRNFHSDPRRIASMLRPLMPVVWPRRSSAFVGEKVAYDLAFYNETNRPVTGKIVTTLINPNGERMILGSYDVPAMRKDIFTYRLQANLATPALTMSGTYKLAVKLGNIEQTRDLLVIAMPAMKPLRVGVMGSLGGVEEDLGKLPNVKTELFHSDRKYDVLIAGGAGKGTEYGTDDNVAIAGTDDPTLYRRQVYGKKGSMEITVSGLSDAPAKVTLLFAETYHRNAGARRFDVRINGDTVLHDFDIFAETGGTNRATTKTFTVQPIDGAIVVAPGEVQADNATFAGIKLETAEKTVAYYFGARRYTDKSGQVWQPYVTSSRLAEEALRQVRTGTPLLIATGEDAVADAYARQLASEGAFRYDGLVGRGRAPWMGSWTFVRKHPTYDGLPVNEVMHSDYGIGPSATNGLVVSGSNLQIITGYGRDHDRRLGAVDFTAPLGKGIILFHSLPPANEPLQRRWLANALGFLTR